MPYAHHSVLFLLVPVGRMVCRIPYSLPLAMTLLAGLACSPPSEPTNDTRAKSTSNASQAILGRVVSDELPVVGATVRYKGTAISVRSDYDGRFRLPPLRGAQTITASKEGFVIAGVTSSTEPMILSLHPLPSGDAEDYVWVDPTPDARSSGNCGNCHDTIYEEWKADGHARGLANRKFLNLYEGSDWTGAANRGWNLLEEYPEGAGVCATCHTPSASLEQLSVGDIREIRGTAAMGVHCDFCHKVQEVVTDAIGLTHGRFGMNLLRPDASHPHGQLFFGPLDDVDRGEDSFAKVYGQSRYCASCHEGTVFGVPVYSTYSEWLASPAKNSGKQCQDCHMTPTGKMTNIAPGAGGIERDPMTLGRHTMLAGGRAAMLAKCVEVKVATDRQADSIHASIDLRTHDVGHRVPTGFIDRHLILCVEAFDADKQPLMATKGSRLPSAAGDLASQAGQLFAKRWVNEEGSPIPFWRAGGTLSDNRLAPDTITRETFEFPAQAKQIRVRLIFRAFWYATAQDKNWPEDAIVLFDQTVSTETSP